MIQTWKIEKTSLTNGSFLSQREKWKIEPDEKFDNIDLAIDYIVSKNKLLDKNSNLLTKSEMIYRYVYDENWFPLKTHFLEKPDAKLLRSVIETQNGGYVTQFKRK